MLARGFAAWRETMQAAAVKQEVLQRAVQQRNRQLLQQAWQVRGWGFVFRVDRKPSTV
jgi:hypothetical protein